MHKGRLKKTAAANRMWGGVYFCTEWVEEKNGENLYGAWV
jgi:hypothetical protein